MFTSDFTLEILSPATLNIPPKPMPSQLQRLAMPQSTWASIYDDAVGLAKRKAARDAAKKELDASSPPSVPQSAGFASLSLGTSKKREQKRERKKAEVDRRKAEHDENTKAEWDALVKKCNASLAGYGVSAGVLRDPKTDNSEFGVAFRCDAARLGPSKLELRFDPRRGAWTWPRRVPEELASMHVDSQSWTTVWDEADATLKRVIDLEEKKREIQSKIDLVDSGMSPMGGMAATHDGAAVSRAIRYSSTLIEEKFNVKQDQEFEWRKLLEYVEDIMFMRSISVRLMTHECARNLGYCGLVFRFRPLIVQTNAVAAIPVVAAAITASQATD